MKTLILIITSFFAFMAHAHNAHHLASKSDVKAADAIESSFSAIQTGVKSSELEVDKVQMVLSKSALEKEFLMQVHMTGQSEIPLGSGLKSRIVAFRLKHGKLYLLEATKGHQITDELPQTLLLTEFPVIKETEETIQFDFNRGMSQIFTVGDWAASDTAGTSYNREMESAEVRMSYIEEISSENNTLMIQQMAQIKGANETVSVKYYLSPYRPDETYKPVKTADFRQFGFFEVSPVLQTDGSTHVYASRFHPEKTMTFAISANTPEAYKAAVRDGILYWNTAFGKEVVKAVEAPAGVTAPSMKYNVIQWINWDQAGFAYADAQMDPRTGQIHHAQVYFTSVFAFSGVTRARRILADIESEKELPLKRMGLRGFTNKHHCFYKPSLAFSGGLSELLTQSQSDEKIMKISQDYVREVVAHEVGHTLGLRHNFAGSLAINYPLEKRSEIFNQYVKDMKKPEGIVPASSVMEYSNFEEAVMVGDQIHQMKEPLLYDQKVIENLYLGKKFARTETPLFCTDSHTRAKTKLIDCERFDIGATAMDHAVEYPRILMEQLPARLLHNFIALKDPFFGEAPKPLDEFPMDPKVEAGRALTARSKALLASSPLYGLVSVRHKYGKVTPLNKEEIERREDESIMSSIERLGGTFKAYETFAANKSSELYQKFAEMIDSGKYDTGIGSGGRPYEFTTADKELMKKIARQFFDKFQDHLVRADISTFAQPVLLGTETAIKIKDTPYGDNLAQLFAEKVKAYALSTTADPFQVVEVKTKDDKIVQWQLSKFTYPVDIRKSAMGLLKAGRGLGVDWGLDERYALNNEWKEDLKTALGGEESTNFTVETLPKKARRWFLENTGLSLGNNY